MCIRDSLYTRLNKDSLLVEVGEEVIRRRLFLKWGTVVAAMLTGVVCLMSVWWLMPGNDTKNLNLVIQENREKSTLVTTLEDGSIVYLGQESVLQYPEHFATDKREVKMCIRDSNRSGMFLFRQNGQRYLSIP